MGLFLSASSDFDAKYLKKNIIYKLNADGSSMIEYYSKVKLHTYRASNRLFGESFIKYNPDFQKLDVLLSKTTMKDGKIVNSPKNAFNEVLPFLAKKFPVFAGLKEMVVTHVGIERGAVIELKYRLYTKPGFNTYFSGLQYLSELFPMKELKVKVIIPKNKKLKFYLSKNEKLLKKKITENHIEYSLLLKDVDHFSKEPMDNRSRDFFVFSDAENLAEIFPARYSSTDIPDGLLKPVTKILNSTTSNLERLFKIQKIVVSDFDFCRLNSELTGNRVRKIKQVYKSNYATSMEKAFMLSEVLKANGIKNDIIASFEKEQILKKVPSLSIIKAFYIKVNDLCDFPVFIDPIHLQSGSMPKGLIGQSYYNLKTGKFGSVEKPDYSKNKIEISGDIELKGVKYKGKLMVKLTGANFDYKSSLKGKKYIKKSLSKFINISKILKFKILAVSVNSMTAKVKLEGKILKTLQKGYLIFKGINFQPVSPGNSFLKKRLNKMILSGTQVFKLNLNIKYPETLSIDYMVKNKKIENSLGVFVNNIKKVSKGLIHLECIRGIKKAIINPDEYSKIKSILDYSNIEKPLLIFKEK